MASLSFDEGLLRPPVLWRFNFTVSLFNFIEICCFALRTSGEKSHVGRRRHKGEILRAETSHLLQRAVSVPGDLPAGRCTDTRRKCVNVWLVPALLTYKQWGIFSHHHLSKESYLSSRWCPTGGECFHSLVEGPLSLLLQGCNPQTLIFKQNVKVSLS